MQVLRREVGVWRVVGVEAADGWVGEYHGSASIRLKPMLVRVDDHGIAVGNRPPGRGLKVLPSQQREESAICRIHMQADAVPVLQGQCLVDGVHRSQPSGAGREHYGSYLSRAQQVLTCGEIHSALTIHRDYEPRHSQKLAHPGMGIVRVRAVGDAEVWMCFPGDE